MKTVRYILYVLLFGAIGSAFSQVYAAVVPDGDRSYSVVISDPDDDRAWLGVQIKDLTRKLRQELDTKARYGVVIDEVVDNSPADEAGLEPGDVILKIDDKNVRKVSDLTNYLSRMSPEDEIELQVMRGNERVNITVILGSRAKKNVWFSGKIPNIQFKGFSPGSSLGIKVHEMDSDLADYFDVSEEDGVLVIWVDEDGPAYNAGIRSGDILTAIDGEEITDAESIQDILSEYDEGQEVELEYVRKGRRESTTVTLEHKPFSFKSFAVPNVEIPPLPEVDGLRSGRGGAYRFGEEEKKEYEREMKELRREMEQLREELQRLKKELNE